MNDCNKLPDKLKPNGLDCSYSRYVFLQNNTEDDSSVKIDIVLPLILLIITVLFLLPCHQKKIMERKMEN